MKQIKVIMSGMILSLGIFSVFLSPAANAFNAVEYPISKDSVWQIGMLVALDDKGETTYASTATESYVGVVSAVDGNSIDVATSGTVQVLVTDEAGAVKTGSQLQVSRVAGVASTEAGLTSVGIVSEAPTIWSQAQLQSDESKSVQVGIAQVQLLEQGGGSSSSTNPFLATLQKTGNGVAGRTVDMWRIITALILGLGGLILSFGLLFISSRESFFSMGRNPMASTIIMRGLWKIVLLSVLIMCVSLGAAYAVLRIS